MEAPSSYFAVLPVMALPDGTIPADEDTAAAYSDVEEAISTARWLVGGGWIGVVVCRGNIDPLSASTRMPKSS